MRLDLLSSAQLSSPFAMAFRALLLLGLAAAEPQLRGAELQCSGGGSPKIIET